MEILRGRIFSVQLCLRAATLLPNYLRHDVVVICVTDDPWALTPLCAACAFAAVLALVRNIRYLRSDYPVNGLRFTVVGCYDLEPGFSLLRIGLYRRSTNICIIQQMVQQISPGHC
jgi:hypothetical protein